MENIQAISNEICEVNTKIGIAQYQAEEAKRNVEQQKAKLLEIEAEKEKINKIFECLQTLDVSKIKTPILNVARLPEAIEIIRNIHNELNNCRGYVHDCQRLLTQYENDFAKYNKEVKTLTVYLQGLSMRLKFKIESEKQMLDNYFINQINS